MLISVCTCILPWRALGNSVASGLTLRLRCNRYYAGGDRTMRKTVTGTILLLAVCPGVFANTGVFSGSGHTLQLAKSADVRMVSEDVYITPICGPSATTHSLEFRCTFVLQNLSERPLKIQVGFPLDQEPRLIKGAGYRPGTVSSLHRPRRTGYLSRAARRRPTAGKVPTSVLVGHGI